MTDLARTPAQRFFGHAIVLTFQAQCGMVSLRGRLELALLALQCLPDSRPGEAARAFLGRIDADSTGAAEALRADLDRLFPRHNPPDEAFEWQKRADLR